MNKVYDIITEKIIEKLENGCVPWRMPWKGNDRPKNLITKKAYTGINPFILISAGYRSPYWLSFKQAQGLGGNVRKGEKGTMVIFWKMFEPKTSSGDDKSEMVPVLRYYTVFNTDQIDGISGKVPELENTPNFQPIDACETIVNGMPNKPEIQFREQRAYYNPNSDHVNMPIKESFEKEDYYYSVLFHELTHSTGHEKRLARKQAFQNAFGSEKYSKEELVAEMGAAFLAGHTGIEQSTIDMNASYIDSWLKALRGDSKLVVLAAAQAQKAANYILNADATS